MSKVMEVWTEYQARMPTRTTTPTIRIHQGIMMPKSVLQRIADEAAEQIDVERALQDIGEEQHHADDEAGMGAEGQRDEFVEAAGRGDPLGEFGKGERHQGDSHRAQDEGEGRGGPCLAADERRDEDDADGGRYEGQGHGHGLRQAQRIALQLIGMGS